MIKNYKKRLLNGVLCGVLVAYTGVQLQAAELEIKNDGASEIDVIVEGGTGTVGKNKNIIKRTLKPNTSMALHVDKDTFGRDSFSVTGKSNIPSANNRCELLLVEKDYKILFIQGKADMIICKAVEK
jgi:hypothetical protein